MKLERLRFLIKEVDKDLADADLKGTCYYRYLDKWHVLDSDDEIAAHSMAQLEKAKTTGDSTHAPKSRVAWFPVSEPDCVISIEFPSSPSASTRNKQKDRLADITARALNAFKVAHNQLTMLLARDAFRSELSQRIAALAQQDSLAAENQEEDLPHLLAVIAFDIDHFKQINDNYGHPYGDQVLRAFAVRLESVAQNIESSSRVKVSLAHPSGEEFLASISGPCTRDEVLTWANLFRTRIAENPLPSEEEWNWLHDGKSKKSAPLPPLQERTVRTSVGVAFYSASTQMEEIEVDNSDTVATLIHQADTALFRAKTGGRNKVVTFEDILERCGRTLEQDPTTKIIAIDIGSNVGVGALQEFRVFAEGFTGQRKFTVNDGRTIRTIGYYPKVPLTFITVFDVQAELSFAYVSDPADRNIEIKPGCHIEALPTGSIYNRAPYEAKYFPSASIGTRIGDVKSLHDFASKAADEKKKTFALVLRLSRESSYKKKYGSAAVTSAITRLYREAQATFTTGGEIGVLDTSSVCIVGPAAAFKTTALEKFISEYSREIPEAGLIGGVYVSDGTTAKDDDIDLQPRHCIDFARLAVSDFANAGDEKIAIFSTSLANKILQEQRDRQLFSSGEADFIRFEELGLINARILNLAGLIQSGLGRPEKAMELYERAAALKPTVLVYKGNSGVAANRCAEIERGLKTLNTISDQELASFNSTAPHGFAIYALLLAKAKIGNLSERNDVRLHSIAKTALTNEKANLTASQKETISSALETS